ncbi:MAG: hypothetical protein LKM39_00010 [Chiayiivirga sp.]|jgi:GDP-L-fucose synthase|nr:hypothetical protein [Chiayiivirga sp.]
MRHYSDERTINVGSGEELSIAQLAQLVADTVGFAGALRFDPAKPDGTGRKLLDSSSLARLGWRLRYTLKDGLRSAYCGYLPTVD